jgi:2-amino-4-hydroxy-6-hydroxymethyldihydropteridine diphosphokinase
MAALQDAQTRLAAAPGIRILQRSSVYDTEPLGMTDQPWFLNQVLSVETTLEPLVLLDTVQGVERALGRIRSIQWGPRTIDIDILLYGDESVSSERLTIPHPRLPGRRFVLLPLVELEPDARLPDGRWARDLLDALEDGQVARRI